jgi:hypothetical protein
MHFSERMIEMKKAITRCNSELKWGTALSVLVKGMSFWLAV